MKRAITGFARDEEGDWVAELDCCHGQHVRHRPPFVNRPWAASEAGREAMIGRELNCRRCDRMEWPEGLEPYRRTPEFDERTIPTAFRSEHATKSGVWARIHVTSGSLDYHVSTPIGQSFRVDSSSPAVIVPEVPHRVEPEGPLRFLRRVLPGAEIAAPPPRQRIRTSNAASPRSGRLPCPLIGQAPGGGTSAKVREARRLGARALQLQRPPDALEYLSTLGMTSCANSRITSSTDSPSTQ